MIKKHIDSGDHNFLYNSTELYIIGIIYIYECSRCKIKSYIGIDTRGNVKDIFVRFIGLDFSSSDKFIGDKIRCEVSCKEEIMNQACS